MIYNKAFRIAENAAKRSRLKHHRTGAALFDKKGRLIEVGWSHTISPGSLTTTPWTKHAEHHAIERASKILSLDVCETIVVVTLTRSGNLTMAAPCDACRKKINDTNIKNVIYSEWIR